MFNKINPLKDIKERLDELEINVGIQEEEDNSNSNYDISRFGFYPWLSKRRTYKRIDELDKRIDELDKNLKLLLEYLKLEKTTQKARTFYHKKKTK